MMDDLSENPTFDSIKILTGIEVANKLSELFGGRCLEIPLHARPNSQLALAVGMDAAKEIINVYGGMRWTVPSTPGRRVRVIEMRKNGHSLSEIAKEERITTRGVAYILETEAAKNQGDLFGE